MGMKHKPCAYCGRREYPRERGHIIPDCMYPCGGDPKVQRPTVPECSKCKMIWQDAEAHFRTFIVMCGDPNAQVLALWHGPILRSFTKSSGRRWVQDISEQMVPVETPTGPRHMLFPERDERVMLVMRKIVRGFCSYHKLEQAIADSRVDVVVAREPVPEMFHDDFTHFSLGDQFCRYSYSDLRSSSDADFHSMWVIEFFGRTRFYGLVSAAKEGWPRHAA